METIPKWFWISLLVIAIIAIVCYMRSKKVPTLTADTDLGPLNAVDDINSLQFL